MKRKALMRVGFLTIASVILVSLLLMTVGPAQTGGVHCKILPDTPADRQNYCPNCGQATATCPKNDCSCADAQCAGWVQNYLCNKITVCAAVCNDASQMGHCTEASSPARKLIIKDYVAPGGIAEGMLYPEKMSGYISPGVPKLISINRIGGCENIVQNGQACSESMGCKIKGITSTRKFLKYEVGGTAGEVTLKVCPFSDVSGKCHYNETTPWTGDQDCNSTLICCNATDKVPSSDRDLGLTGRCIFQADLNRDCKVDIRDVFIVAKKFGQEVKFGEGVYI